MDKMRLNILWKEHINYKREFKHQTSSDRLDDILLNIHGEIMLDDTLVAGIVSGFLSTGRKHIETHVETLRKCIEDLEFNIKRLQEFRPKTNLDTIYQEEYIKLTNRLLEMSRLLMDEFGSPNKNHYHRGNL